jgi:putative hydrolase of HD superfamily
MKGVVDFLFEARMLKKTPRSGYAFLGAGGENVAEHSFLTAFIGMVICRLIPGVDREKLITMCLIHDLCESRTGDMNHVQKRYVKVDESAAVSDATGNLSFGECVAEVIEEFNHADTLEAHLARDSDRLALMLDLKALSDIGYGQAQKWLGSVKKRIQTDIGKQLADQIFQTDSDSWWNKNNIDS